MHRSRVAMAAVPADDDFDIMIERHQESQQALDRKLPEFPSQHLGRLAGLDLMSLYLLNGANRRFFVLTPAM